MNNDQTALFGDEPEPQTPPLAIPEHRHGTVTGYRYGCRCAKCKTAKQLNSRGINVCQECGRQYRRYDPEAGTKYCSTKCKQIGYTKGFKRAESGTLITCLTCGTEEPHRKGSRYDRWQMCRACYQKLKDLGAHDTLARHGAEAHHAHQLLADPTCQTCRTPLGQWLNTHGGTKRRDIAIDHDHTCCPGSYGCAKCIRGVLCHRCNITIGQARDNPELLQAMADYLTKWEQR